MTDIDITGRIKEEPLLGIIGGVGTLATAFFVKMLAEKTKVKTDQDHINYLCYNHATSPDRTAYILDGSKPNPLPILIEDVKWLESAGVSSIVIPCNTAHYFYDMLQTSVNIPIINILEETVSAAISRYDGAGKIGILATEGTVKSNSYQMVCRRHGIEPAVPGGADQAALMSVIYDQVKSGGDADIGVLTHIAGSLVAEGCGAVIFGCTELSIVYNASPGRFRELPIVDSMDVLADVAIGMMGKSLK